MLYTRWITFALTASVPGHFLVTDSCLIKAIFAFSCWPCTNTFVFSAFCCQFSVVLAPWNDQDFTLDLLRAPPQTRNPRWVNVAFFTSHRIYYQPWEFVTSVKLKHFLHFPHELETSWISSIILLTSAPVCRQHGCICSSWLLLLLLFVLNSEHFVIYELYRAVCNADVNIKYDLILVQYIFNTLMYLRCSVIMVPRNTQCVCVCTCYQS